MFKELKSFFKIGIVIFVLISAAAGYGLGHPFENSFDPLHFFIFLLGTFFISSGSLALNQIQEVDKDAKMPRTQSRPLPRGAISKKLALTISLTHIILGLTILYFKIGLLTFAIGALIIGLYNGPYTLFWKMKWAFGAVPGAIPGALPAVLGFSAVNPHILSPASLYLFFIMFLWQMPHFWALAIRFKDDYAKGEFPVLPVVVGDSRTIYHISFYVAAYALLAIMSPFFVEYYVAYFILTLPFALIVVWQFMKFYKHQDNSKSWLPFFLWTNFSIMAFLIAPLIDRWWPMVAQIN